MARWSEVEVATPELAVRAKSLFDARTHKTMATLRRDGSPRISGTESLFVDGDLWLGCMWQAKRALDLQRDPRFALHSGSEDQEKWTGDAKLSGTLEEITDPKVIAQVVKEGPPPPFHLFRAEISELSVVSIAANKKSLLVETWSAARGTWRVER
jgi:hypothetical protein